jgi:uncharacterized protein (DUF1330 family)
VAAYVIYQGEVFDAKRYDDYKTKAAASILAGGGRYLVRGGDVEVLEGEAPAGRTVVLEFPSMQAALDWYRSDEYTEIRKSAKVQHALACRSSRALPELRTRTSLPDRARDPNTERRARTTRGRRVSTHITARMALVNCHDAEIGGLRIRPLELCGP